MLSAMALKMGYVTSMVRVNACRMRRSPNVKYFVLDGPLEIRMELYVMAKADPLWV